MPRKQKVTADFPTDTTLTSVPDLETQASDAEVKPLLPADHPAVLEQQNKNDRFGKKYTAEQLVILNQFAAAMLAGSINTGMHPDAVLTRTRIAFENAKAMLCIAEEVQDLDADSDA